MKIVRLGGPGQSRAIQDGSPHILLVVDQFPKTLGGGEGIVLRLAALLPKYGFSVSILTFSYHHECRALRTAACPIYLLPLRRTYDLGAVLGALELRRFIREHRIEIVQTFFESSDLWAGLVTKTMSKARLIWSRRDMGILRTKKHNIAYRLFGGLPDAVFAVSDRVRRHSIEVDRIDPDRVVTIYNGLDLRERTVSCRPHYAGETLIVTVGNIRRVKGHDVLIRAAREVVSQFPSVLFWVAGDVLERSYFEELQALVCELDLSERFRFVGGVSDVSGLLASADIFVLSSRSEGFSNAIVEAMIESLPIVATDVGGNAEAVRNGINGFIVPSDDPGALATAIIQLLSNPLGARQMGSAGRKIAEEMFTTKAMMDPIVATYGRLLTAKARAS